MHLMAGIGWLIERQMSRAVNRTLGVPARAPMHTPPLCICTTPMAACSGTLHETHAMGVAFGQLKIIHPANPIKLQFSRPSSCQDTFQSALNKSDKGDNHK